MLPCIRAPVVHVDRRSYGLRPRGTGGSIVSSWTACSARAVEAMGNFERDGCASPPSECVVQLRCASLPSVLGLIADHYWFVVIEGTGTCHRWEVWQTSNAGGTSIGHV